MVRSLEIDNLTYTYSSNRLTQIAESGAPGPSQAWYWMHGFKTGSGTAGYGYDANGNMVSDGHKGMSVEYNHLNLPKTFTFAEGKWIKILYDASGTKLKMESSTGAQTHYAGDLEYGFWNGTIKLNYFYHDEGRCLIEGTTYAYDYNLKDHLGSTHRVARENGSFDLSQLSMYYPFGLLWEGLHGIGQLPDNRYTYNGKEWNREHGLEWYDYGARWYDAAVGRWWSGDPLKEKYTSYSPYAYVLNRPIVAIDPDGKRVYFVSGANNDQDGWNYMNRWGQAFRSQGVDFKRVDASHGMIGDMLFTSGRRHRFNIYEDTYIYSSNNALATVEMAEKIKNRKVESQIGKALDFYRKDLKDNPLKDGEQFNLAGYSYGSVMQAQVALQLAKEGKVIDNLILIGSPISDKSEL